MARTSRRFENKKVTVDSKTLYKAGIYTRLSNERTESWRNKSSSIETQILNCKEYALKENIQVVSVFTDYEYSGTNFNRPEFQNMMQAVRDRKINCIIIRDLSRLGREYLEMGRLIDKVFPFLGVRFISVNDKLDTIKEVDTKKSFEVTIKNIINDMYAKDISVKIKSSKLNRARNGYFIGSVPPYGYKVTKEKEGQKLEVDENIRFVVEEIFSLSAKGLSQLQVTRQLNEKAYATATVYYNTGRIYREESDPQWNVGSLSKILTNPVYMGDLVQGVKSQYLAEGKKQHYADKEDYIVVEDAHEAIISRDLFEKVQNGRKERLRHNGFSKRRNDLKRDPENRYKGLVFYSKTGEELFRRTRINTVGKKKVLSYLYRNERFDGSIHNKKSIFIMETDLDERVVSDISKALKNITNKSKFTKRIKEKYSSTIEFYKDKIKTLESSIQKEEYSIQKAYEQYSLGSLDRDNYLLERDVYQGRINQIEKEKISHEDYIAQIKKDRKKALAWIDNIYSAKGLNKLSGELIENLIEKVIVYDTHDFEVIYKFNMESLKEVAGE